MKSPQSGPNKLSSQASETAETTNIVTQPAKLNEFMEVINLMGTVSEKIAEHHSQYVGPSGGQIQAGSGSTTVSARDTAIASLPAPKKMQQKLVTYIEREIRSLEKLSKRVAFEKKQGWAYELTKIFARIRRLSALAREIVRASVDTIKRFYIHVFIDNQPILQGVAVPLDQ